jgi:hypothetical protein
MHLPLILLVASVPFYPLVQSHYPAVKEMLLERLGEKRPVRIVLIGASVGKGWNIPALPERINNHDYVFEYVYSGGFDKSQKLDEVLSRIQDRPEAIFLKECAAYFPGDIGSFKRLMGKWINDCIEAGVLPIPATVAPVTRLHSFKKFGIDILKLRNPFRQGTPFQQKRQKAILEYNDWLRKYCQETDLLWLDLEKALRKRERNRCLRSRFAKVDGLHLNKRGYQALDAEVLPLLGKVKWNMAAGRPDAKN